MLARFLILLPYRFSIPADSEMVIFTMTLDGHTARIFPPFESSVDRSILDATSPVPMTAISAQLYPAAPQHTSELVTIDGRPTIQADTIRVEFEAEEFDRGLEADEPLVAVAFDMVNDLLARLRSLGRAGHVKPVDAMSTSWRVDYLNDDGSELARSDDLRRGLGGVAWRWTNFALPPDLWAAIAGLPEDFEPGAWDTLLLHAFDHLPEIGPAIFLAAAAVETRIESALDVLAANQGIKEELWDWVSGRGASRRRGPAVIEQASSLLEALAGQSLKSEQRLWQGFDDLRKARNAFAHEGVARIGQDAVDAQQAGRLLATAVEIIDWIETLLPAEHRRPRYAREGERFAQLTKWLTARGSDGSTESVPPPK